LDRSFDAVTRRVLVLVFIGATAVVLATVALAVTFGGDHADGGGCVGSTPPPGIPMGKLELRSHDGTRVSSSDLRGKVTLLTFLDSQCTESCPVIAWTVARTLDALAEGERSRVRAVAISSDPKEDTARAVRQFLARNRALGRLEYVGGGQSESELRPVWSAFMVLSSLESGQDTLHSAPVRIYDRRGVWVSTLHAGADLSEESLANDIRVALAS